MPFAQLVIENFTIPELRQLLHAPNSKLSKVTHDGLKLEMSAEVFSCYEGHNVKFFMVQLMTNQGKSIARRAVLPNAVNVPCEFELYEEC